MGLMYEIIYYIVELSKVYLITFGIFRCYQREYQGWVKIGTCMFCAILAVLLSVHPSNQTAMLVDFMIIGNVTILLKSRREFPFVLFGFLGISLIDAMNAGVVCKAMNISIDVLKSESLLRQKVNGFSLILVIGICLILQIRSKSEKSRPLQYSNSTIKSLLVVLIVVCLIGFYQTSAEVVYLDSPKSTIQRLMETNVITISLLVLCGVYIACITKQEYDKRTMDSYIQFVEQQKRYYEELLERNGNVRKIKHDIREHLGVIQTFILRGNINRALEYLNSVRGEIDGEGASIHTGNTVVDIVMSDTIAHHKEVQMKVRGSVPNKLNMADMDICILFSNLFRNAVEAVEKTAKKEICLDIQVQGSNLFIIETNAYEGERKFKKGHLSTSKENRDFHGLGTKSMEEVVRRYGGNLQFYVTDRFRVEIFLGNIISE